MKTCKRLLALLLALTMLTALLTACGKKDADDAALTEEEYQTAVTELNDKLTSIQTDASALDPNDPDAAKQLLEDMKAPFQDFINITPPASYADAHEKMKSGCQAMIDYLDTVNSMLEETDEGKLQEAANTMMEQLQTAVTDLTEGATMLSEAHSSSPACSEGGTVWIRSRPFYLPCRSGLKLQILEFDVQHKIPLADFGVHNPQKLLAAAGTAADIMRLVHQIEFPEFHFRKRPVFTIPLLPHKGSKPLPGRIIRQTAPDDLCARDFLFGEFRLTLHFLHISKRAVHHRQGNNPPGRQVRRPRKRQYAAADAERVIKQLRVQGPDGRRRPLDPLCQFADKAAILLFGQRHGLFPAHPDQGAADFHK